MVKGQARDKILDTAETLFAEQGIEAVSLRAINAAAGVSPGVLHYHFGNRDALVEQLLERHMERLTEQRRQRLAPLAEQSHPPLTQVIEALVMPLADFVLQGGEEGRRYIRFIARLHNERSPLLEQTGRRYNQTLPANFVSLLGRACPELSRAEIAWRLNAANAAILNTLTELTTSHLPWMANALQASGEEAPSDAAVVELLLDFVVGGFKGSR